MNKTLIKNARIVNEGRSFVGSVLIEDDKIAAVYEQAVPESAEAAMNLDAAGLDVTVIDATGKLLMPGAIDDQVHFRRA